MVGFDNSNPGLQLGLGLGHCMMKKKEEEDPSNKLAYPSLKLGPPNQDDYDDDDLATNSIIDDQLVAATKIETEDWFLHHPHASSNNSPSAAVSSLISNSSTIIKRERDHDDQFSGDDEELEPESENTTNPSRVVVDVEESGSSPSRKKLRLTKEQSQVLEDSFKQHSTLNPKQKQELARRLELRTRQVEVWFQNRRARTKLKQTESDLELLKNYCETLTEENKRLQKELQELKSMMKTTPEQFYMQIPVTNLTICSSCKRICGDDGNNGSSTTIAATTAKTLLISPKRSIITYPRLAIGASYS